MYLKIKIVDIEWDDHEYEDLPIEEKHRFKALPKEVFVVLDWETSVVPSTFEIKSNHMLSFEVCYKLSEKYGFDQYDWDVEEVVACDELEQGPDVYSVESDEPNETDDIDESLSSAGDNLPAEKQPVPNVVFEIEQNGKVLELVRVSASEYDCGKCPLNSGDYTACNVCKALSEWETRGGFYMFKEKVAK